jgi:RNA polymerase sigma factor (sigma-70 family)
MAMGGPTEFAYDRVLEAHWHDVFRFALAWTNDWAEAEDLTQEAYLRLWNNRARLDWDRPVLPWLLVTVRRLATDRFRRLRRRLVTAPEPASLDASVHARWLDVQAAMWRPNHDQIVVTAKTGDNVTFWVVDSDGTKQRQIPVSKYAINVPTLSPDGTRLAYATWEPVVEGRIRVVDIDAGGDRAITSDDTDHYVWQTPAFSPDGAQILVHRFFQGTYDSQVAMLRADGAGPAIAMGPVTTNPPANPFFSPDGTQILAEYPTLKTFWIFDANGQNGHEAPFKAISGGGATWQRLAP